MGGSQQKEVIRLAELIDLIGQRFGRLVVLKRASDYISPKGCKQPQYLCECDCGNKKVIVGQSLRIGDSKSCGCLRKENSSTINKRYNTYDLTCSYGVGYTYNNKLFYFDLDDYDKIKDYCWDIDKSGYVKTLVDGKKLYLHRHILNNPKDVVDHINGKRNNCMKGNLRKVTDMQNSQNMKTSIANTSGCKGVSYNNQRNKYHSYITVNHKRINLGYFTIKEDAIKARKEAEELYQGVYSYDNSQKILNKQINHKKEKQV